MFSSTAAAFGLLVVAAGPSIQQTIDVDGGVILLTIDRPQSKQHTAEITRWVTNAATAVTRYYGRFPIRRVGVAVSIEPGARVHHGVTYGHNGARITIDVGRDAGRRQFDDDWVLTHEMTHLALPTLSKRHRWLEEGLATYVEPFARLRAGQLTREKVWGDLMRDVHKGQPKRGDRGLDKTHTWGRTYWGGALFCLVADVEIRKQTKNEKGLVDALRAIAAEADVTDRWSIDRVLRIGDTATGVAVLRTQYDQMKDTPVEVDLSALWRQLGTRRVRGRVSFDDDAPRASTRRAIEAAQR